MRPDLSHLYSAEPQVLLCEQNLWYFISSFSQSDREEEQESEEEEAGSSNSADGTVNDFWQVLC